MPTLPATASAIIASALALLVRLMSDSTATSSPQGVHQTWSLTINFDWWKMLEAAKYQDADIRYSKLFPHVFWCCGFAPNMTSTVRIETHGDDWGFPPPDRRLSTTMDFFREARRWDWPRRPSWRHAGSSGVSLYKEKIYRKSVFFPPVSWMFL
jgi:hypothetical protein